jgi:hypothetical protein
MQNAVEIARQELGHFAKHWGLSLLVHADHDDSISNAELIRSYLASSIAFTGWTDVYRAIEGNVVSIEQLTELARKACPVGDSVDKNYAARTRQASVQSALLEGAYFEPEAKATSLYKELRAVLPRELDDTLEVAAFHLMGVSNAIMLVEDPLMGFTVALRPRSRKQLVSDLSALGARWKSNPGVGEQVATMIEHTVYPVLEELGPQSIVSEQQRLSNLSSSSASASSPLGKKQPSQSSTASMPEHKQQPWNTVAERMFADDPRFRRYKASKGWKSFYGSQPTLTQYFADVANRDPKV